MTKHAVFATDHEFKRYRVSKWQAWGDAQDAWSALDNTRRNGELPETRFLEVRASDDPAYNTAPFAPWRAVPTEKRPKLVKLTRPEREALLDLGRAAGDLQAAHDAMLAHLCNDAQWSHLEAVTISDYTWAAAQFCFPHESKYI